MSNIIAKNLKVYHKNGFISEYTHVTECAVHNPEIKTERDFPMLLIKGEMDYKLGGRCNVIDKLPIKNINLTIIEWYLPPE